MATEPMTAIEMMSRIVRYATPEDAAGVCDVLKDSWRAAYVDMLTPDEIELRCKHLFVPSVIAELVLALPRYRHVVAEVDGRIVGFAQCGVTLGGCVCLHMLYVHPEFQRRGIGLDLVTYCVGSFPWARGLALEVLAPNTNAIRFYRRLGMEESGPRFSKNFTSVPIVLMQRPLALKASRWTAFRQFMRLSIGRAPLPMPSTGPRS